MLLPKALLFALAVTVGFPAITGHVGAFFDRSVSYPAGPKKAGAFPSLDSPNAQAEIRQTDLFPIQLKDPKELGLGKLLVASRNVGDPNFAKTVILLVHYDDKGVVGLILNRRTRFPLSRVLDSVPAAKERSDPVYFGGPVEVAVVSGLLQSSTQVEGAQNVFGGIYLILTKSGFERTISARADQKVFRAYLGYAGWTPDQLRKETALGSWFIFPADAATIFNSDPDTLWPQLIARTEAKFARADRPPVFGRSNHTMTR